MEGNRCSGDINRHHATMHINVAALPLLSKSARSDESLDSLSISDDDAETSDWDVGAGECAVEEELAKLSFVNDRRLANVSIRVG